MKTKIIFILLCFLSLNVMGQGIITRESTRRTKAKKSKTEQPARQNPVRKQTSSKQKQNSSPLSQPSGYVVGHGYVDLGLSVKWATCNVGATRPEEYGDYFAWGETSPKSEYTWANLKYKADIAADGTVMYSKYVIDSKYGIIDNRTVLELNDDAAHANWGSSWRMPTREEQDELEEKCTWTWTTMNGKNGYKVTSKSNGNSIFLPAAGFWADSSLFSTGSRGCYWSSSLGTRPSAAGCCFSFRSDYVLLNTDSRRYGLNVRPVCP